MSVTMDMPRSNIQNIGGNLYVAFAKRGEGIDEAAGPGLGFVDVILAYRPTSVAS